MSNNIFTSLGRYTSPHGEDFLTEAFVYLLNLLLEKDLPFGLSILTNLCGETCASWFGAIDDISITTQLTIKEGRPDIVVRVGTERIVFQWPLRTQARRYAEPMEKAKQAIRICLNAGFASSDQLAIF